MEKYIAEFEGLRAVLAWWVVIGHVAFFSGFTGEAGTPAILLPIARTGVPVHVFIILSGFVIFYLLDRDHRYGPFMRGRVFRIYPVYLVCFFAALALLRVLHQPLMQAPWLDEATHAGHAARLQSMADNLWAHVLLHLTMLHGMAPDQVLPYSGHALLGPAWSLSLEWQFYLIAPFLLQWWQRSRWLFALAAGAILLVKLALLHSDLTFSYGAFLPTKFEYFLLGIATFFAYKYSAATGFTWKPWLWLGAGIVAAFAVMAVTGGMREHFFAVSIWVAVVAAALARMRGWLPDNWLSRGLRTPFMRYLGRISYPTYLVHVIVIDLIAALVVPLVSPDTTSWQAFALLLPPAIAGTWAASHLLHRTIEVPGMQRGRAAQERIDSAQVAATCAVRARHD